MSGWRALMSSGTLICRRCDNVLCKLKDHWRIVTRCGVEGSEWVRPRTQVRAVSDVAPSDCVLCNEPDSASESDAESAQGWSFPGVEVVHVEASLPVSTPMEVSALSTQSVSDTPRAPPRLRIVGTQKDTDGDSLPSTVPAASPLHTCVDMSCGDDSPRVIQAVDSDTESVASSGFLRMFAQDLEAHLAMPPPTWLDIQEDDEVVDSVVPESSPSRRVVRVPQSQHGSNQSLGDRHLEDSGGSAVSQAIIEAHNDERPFADEVRFRHGDCWRAC